MMTPDDLTPCQYEKFAHDLSIKEDQPNEILFFHRDMDAYRTALEPMLVDLKSEVIDRHFPRKLDPGNLKR